MHIITQNIDDLHERAGSISGTHVTDLPEFYRRVAAGCGSAATLLLTGPSTAKHKFVVHLKHHAPHILARIAAIQTLPRVTDPQLVADGRVVLGLSQRRNPAA